MSHCVLVVDDSSMVRRQVRRALEAADFKVIEAEDGVDALAMLDGTVEELALAVCDVNMPRMNGLDLLARLRESPRWRSLPVLMLTTETQPDLVQRARALEAKGWIIKPFKPELFVAAAKKITGVVAPKP